MTGRRLLLLLCVVGALCAASCGLAGALSEPAPADVIDASTLDITYEVSPEIPLRMEACQRVDIVFAIDDSGSMQEEIDAMRQSIFPVFASSLREEVPEFRVGVVDAAELLRLVKVLHRRPLRRLRLRVCIVLPSYPHQRRVDGMR